MLDGFRCIPGAPAVENSAVPHRGSREDVSDAPATCGLDV